MNNIKKSVLLIVVVVVSGFKGASAQEFKDKFFFSNGFSIYTDLVFGLEPVEGSGAGGISIFTYTPNFRYNLTEFDDNSSLSLNVPIGIGLMTSEFGFGSINVPLYIAYNSGNISTYSADKNKGFTIGIGIEYYNMAVFLDDKYDSGDAISDAASWIGPCANIGYRYWNKKNIAREFNLKVGFGPSTTYEYTDFNGANREYEIGSATSVKFTWFRYLNY